MTARPARAEDHLPAGAFFPYAATCPAGRGDTEGRLPAGAALDGGVAESG
jgi:hypothetical protein